jgi:hypothetical protein
MNDLENLFDIFVLEMESLMGDIVEFAVPADFPPNLGDSAEPSMPSLFTSSAVSKQMIFDRIESHKLRIIEIKNEIERSSVVSVLSHVKRVRKLDQNFIVVKSSLKASVPYSSSDEYEREKSHFEEVKKLVQEYCELTSKFNETIDDYNKIHPTEELEGKASTDINAIE